MSTPPSVDPDRIEKFYSDLASMQVELDADPLALGPKRINQKTSECRGFLSRTERMFLEVSQDLYWYKREHRKALADFELAVQELMSNDPEVRAGRNITDRTAIAHTKLRADRERISVLQFAAEDLEAVLSVIRTKRNDLKDIASRLRDQLKICQEEISLGGRWGSSRRILGGPTAPRVKTEADGVEELLDTVLATYPEEDEEEDGNGNGNGEVSLCSVCGLPQFDTPSGLVCANGHGGAPSLAEGSLPEEDAGEILGSIGASPPSRSFPEGKADSVFDSALEDLDSHLPKSVFVEARKDPTLDEILDSFGD